MGNNGMSQGNVPQKNAPRGTTACPGAIHPALVRMEEHGLVEAEEVDRDLRSPTDPESPFARSIGVDASV